MVQKNDGKGQQSQFCGNLVKKFLKIRPIRMMIRSAAVFVRILITKIIIFEKERLPPRMGESPATAFRE